MRRGRGARAHRVAQLCQRHRLRQRGVQRLAPLGAGHALAVHAFRRERFAAAAPLYRKHEAKGAAPQDGAAFAIFILRRARRQARARQRRARRAARRRGRNRVRLRVRESERRTTSCLRGAPQVSEDSRRCASEASSSCRGTRATSAAAGASRGVATAAARREGRVGSTRGGRAFCAAAMAAFSAARVSAERDRARRGGCGVPSAETRRLRSRREDERAGEAAPRSLISPPPHAHAGRSHAKQTYIGVERANAVYRQDGIKRLAGRDAPRTHACVYVLGHIRRVRKQFIRLAAEAAAVRRLC